MGLAQVRALLSALLCSAPPPPSPPFPLRASQQLMATPLALCVRHSGAARDRHVRGAAAVHRCADRLDGRALRAPNRQRSVLWSSRLNPNNGPILPFGVAQSVGALSASSALWQTRSAVLRLSSDRLTNLTVGIQFRHNPLALGAEVRARLCPRHGRSVTDSTVSFRSCEVTAHY